MSQNEMQLQDDHLTDAAQAAEVAQESAQNAVDIKLQSAQELTNTGDLEAANAIYREVLTSIDETFADHTHPHLAECLWNLANNLYVLNLVEECIPVFQRLVSVQEEKLGSEDGALITPLLRLAIALKRAGAAEESEAVFERSMTLAKKVNPEGNLHQPAQSSEKQVTVEKNDTPFVHPSQESEKAKTEATSDVDAHLLKHLFSDNSPLHAATTQATHLSNQDDQMQEAAYAAEPTFVDRNPAATRLSDLDLAALGAIPSPQAMKTMFRDAPPPDPGVRTKAVAFLKTNESTDEPVKFADSSKISMSWNQHHSWCDTNG